MRSRSSSRLPTPRANEPGGRPPAGNPLHRERSAAGSAESAFNDLRAVITSTRNPLVARAVKLHRSKNRRRRGMTLLEGPNLLEAALRSGAVVERVFATVDDTAADGLMAGTGVPLHAVSAAVLERLATTEHPKGPIAIISTPRPSVLEPADTVVLMGVADPGNAGTLIRSAAAFGFQVGVSDGSVDVWSPKVLRAAAGAHFTTPIVPLGNEPLRRLREVGIAVIATTPQGSASTITLNGPAVALLVGSEPRGLDPAVVAAAEAVVTIPTTGRVESLNAGVAGSILMHEIAARRSARS